MKVVASQMVLVAFEKPHILNMARSLILGLLFKDVYGADEQLNSGPRVKCNKTVQHNSDN